MNCLAPWRPKYGIIDSSNMESLIHLWRDIDTQENGQKTFHLTYRSMAVFLQAYRLQLRCHY